MHIQKEIRKGTTIVFIAKYSGIVIGLVINSLLARLLTPKEFGIVAVVTVFISFFNILSDIGLGVAIIQNQSLTERDTSDLFKISIALSFGLAIAFGLSSYGIASFYNNSVYIIISQLLSINVFFSSLSVVPKNLMIKSQSFKALGFIEVISSLATGALAIFLARRGASYYAIVWRAISFSLIVFLLYFHFSKFKIQKGFSFSGIKSIARYSSNQFAFNLINYFSRNLDNILIGKYMNNQSLGIYNQAYQLMMYPIANLTHVITPVLHPVLAKFQHDKKVIYDEYLKVVNILAILGIPISIFTFFSASEIINILLGSQWQGVIPILQILSLSIWIQMILSSSGAIFQAAGRTDLLFISGLISAIIMISSILIGVFYYQSLEVTAFALVLAFAFNFIQCFFILINQLLKQSPWKICQILIKQLPAAIILIAALFIVAYLIDKFHMSDHILFSFVFKLGAVILITGSFQITFLKTLLRKVIYKI